MASFLSKTTFPPQSKSRSQSHFPIPQSHIRIPHPNTYLLRTPVLTSDSYPRKASGVLLQRNPRLLKLPPYLSVLCVVVGVAWLLLLPLDSYSRQTYISENALLPGQVHTYFAGSDQNVFRGYKHEVDALAERGNGEYVRFAFFMRWREGRGCVCLSGLDWIGLK